MTATTGTSAWVIELIEALWAGPGNDMHRDEPEQAWDPPLIGFANGADALWEQYKTVVDPSHWTPMEAWRLAYPDVDGAPGDLTVVSWILPQTEATKRDQREQTLFPAERWSRTRVYGEQANHRLRCDVAHALSDAGFPTVAPVASPQWGIRDSAKYVYTSNWSERHAAYAAGLGTFGLCDGLITPVGKAMRTGSVVARIPIPASPRPYTDHHAYCLFFAKGTCGECIDRCPVGAISTAGHDKLKCEAHLNRSRAYVNATYGFDGYGCGLCQAGVPCESGIPEGIGD